MPLRLLGQSPLFLMIIEPIGSSTDPLAQSQAFAILFLTSDIAPRLKFASLSFPSLLRVVLIDSLPCSVTTE